MEAVVAVVELCWFDIDRPNVDWPSRLKFAPAIAKFRCQSVNMSGEGAAKPSESPSHSGLPDLRPALSKAASSLFWRCPGRVSGDSTLESALGGRVERRLLGVLLTTGAAGGGVVSVAVGVVVGVVVSWAMAAPVICETATRAAVVSANLNGLAMAQFCLDAATGACEVGRRLLLLIAQIAEWAKDVWAHKVAAIEDFDEARAGMYLRWSRESHNFDFVVYSKVTVSNVMVGNVESLFEVTLPETHYT